ncbi:HIRA-interacting protein 3-like [Heterodontus francisci]|uniref:HIRA-interacting protein 3-like n=1 Tax=Heterodontus francisci TaxID=7792 RepID=UPI00355B7CF4
MSEGDGENVSPNTARKHHKKQPTKTNGKESGREEHPSIKRLKRCIVACGVRRNYKKLFENCHSNKAKIRALRRELEDLGIEGNPSLEKCKVLRIKREEQAELASLDVANIIHTEGMAAVLYSLHTLSSWTVSLPLYSLHPLSPRTVSFPLYSLRTL